MRVQTGTAASDGSGDMARLFHRLTSYEPIREGTGWPVRETVEDPWILTSFEPYDMDLLPPVVKTFREGLSICPLPRNLPAPEASTLAVLGGLAAGATPLDLGQMARLLHLSAGVVRTWDWREGLMVLFRAAGSAGARFPLEVYVVVPEGTAGLPAGVHEYRPVEHSLLQVNPPCPVADDVALSRARVPAPPLGRRNGALPAARAR